jgi:hypothetical protein
LPPASRSPFLRSVSQNESFIPMIDGVESVGTAARLTSARAIAPSAPQRRACSGPIHDRASAKYTRRHIGTAFAILRRMMRVLRWNFKHHGEAPVICELCLTGLRSRLRTAGCRANGVRSAVQLNGSTTRSRPFSVTP